MAVIELETIDPPATIIDRDAHKAAQVIRERGWCQGHYEHPDTGAVCAVGAIDKAIGDDDPIASRDLFDRVRDSLGLVRSPDLYGKYDLSLEHWNDIPWRTEKEVIEAFERVAYGV